MITREKLYVFNAAMTRVGLPIPAAVTRTFEILGVAADHRQNPSRSWLTASDDDIRNWITDLSIRHHTAEHTRGMLNGSTFDLGKATGLDAGDRLFEQELFEQLREAVKPELDTIIKALRPRFDEIAAPLVVGAQQYGFTMTTQSDEIVDQDADTIAAWRDVRTALRSIGPYVRVRQAMSETFEVAPTLQHSQDVRTMDDGAYVEDRVDYSVCFAESTNWSMSFRYAIEGKPAGGIDWLALAVGGLRLNSITEVEAKIPLKLAELSRNSPGAVPRNPWAGAD